MNGDRQVSVKVLLTAAEAYPEFEAQVLDAETEISCGFRIFDPWTELVSDRAREIGVDWFDLIAHTLKRGVSFRLVLTDFDPVARPHRHRAAWASFRALIAAAEVSGRPELLEVKVALHPAQAGLIPRMLIWPKSFGEIAQVVRELNLLSPSARKRALSEMPQVMRQVLLRNGKLQAKRWPVPLLYPTTHHQKLAVFDRRRLYIGGLDLNDRRFDTPDHNQASDQTWHDLQLLVEGEVARDAHEHLESFEDVLAGIAAPKPSSLLRTMTSKRRWALPYLSPRLIVSELSEAHFSASENTEHLIYLETQYFRDRALAKHLVSVARAKPDLSMILIIPAAPDDVAFQPEVKFDARFGEYLQVESLKALRAGFGERLFVGAPAQPCSAEGNGPATHCGAPIIYLHAKVSIFDEREAIVSSANLNGRSLKWDTETGLRLDQAGDVSTLKRRCFEHWLGSAATPEHFDGKTALNAWRDLAAQNEARVPEERQGFILPYDIAPSARRGRNVPGVPEEMF